VHTRRHRATSSPTSTYGSSSTEPTARTRSRRPTDSVSRVADAWSTTATAATPTTTPRPRPTW
jgi:hypothetical protein